MMDMLATIMKKQCELQNRLGFDYSTMTPQECAAYMRDNRGYLDDEVAEALYEMPYYKSWKNYDNMSEEEVKVAWQKVRMELVDSLHFFVNLLLCAGFTPEELCEMYVAKNKENHRRQDVGYTADQSYRDQPVEDVMNGISKCIVHMDGESIDSDDFIAILAAADGSTKLYYNTDVLTVGLAIKELSLHYEKMMAELTPEERDEVREVLVHE